MTLQKAIIVDLDGTLVANQHRPPALYANDNGVIDWDAWTAGCVDDPVAEWCLDLVNAMSHAGYHILFLTRRGERPDCREITEHWLNGHLSPDVDYTLIMGPWIDDGRPDSVVKLEKYYNEIAPYYSVAFAVDDKKENVQLFRSLGIPGLHCADY